MKKVAVRDIFSQQKHRFFNGATSNHVNDILVRSNSFHKLDFLKEFSSLFAVCHICVLDEIYYILTKYRLKYVIPSIITNSERQFRQYGKTHNACTQDQIITTLQSVFRIDTIPDKLIRTYIIHNSRKKMLLLYQIDIITTTTTKQTKK